MYISEKASPYLREYKEVHHRKAKFTMSGRQSKITRHAKSENTHKKGKNHRMGTYPEITSDRISKQSVKR